MRTPKLRHPGAAAFMAIALALLPLRGLAEDSNTAPASASVTIPAAPAPQTDRKDGSGAAAAMAAVGAGIAGLSCMMMMKQAKEEPDPSTKNMMMMMAMQQCAQAAANAANAAQNQKGKENLTSPAVTPELKTQAAAATPTKAAEEAQLPAESSTPEAVAQATEVPAATETQSGVVDNSAFDKKADPLIVAKEEVALGSSPKASTPNVIPEARVGFDDAAKPEDGGSSGGPNPGLGGLSAGSGAGPAANAQGAKDLSSLLKVADARGVNKEGAGETHGEGSAGGGDKAEKGPEPDMNAMLAQLMGGGAPAAAEAGPANGVINLKEFASANKGEAGEELPNIFQYASYRYRALKKENGVGTKSIATAKNSFLKAPATLALARNTAAVPPKKGKK